MACTIVAFATWFCNMPRISTYTVVCALLYTFTWAAPAPNASGSPAVSAAEPTATVPFIKDDPNNVLPTNGLVQPIRGALGANILGPDNQPMDKQNPDLLAPPTTDQGTV